MSEKSFLVEVSARHVHLSKEDVAVLFGEGKKLTYVRDLSQPGQFVCEERVDIVGPKRTISNVVILGPERKESHSRKPRNNEIRSIRPYPAPRYGQPRPVHEDTLREFPSTKNRPPPPIGRFLTPPCPLSGPLGLA